MAAKPFDRVTEGGHFELGEKVFSPRGEDCLDRRVVGEAEI